MVSKVARIDRPRSVELAPARREPELTLVPPATPGERARRLYAEARSVSLEHLADLQASLALTRELVQSVADSGELYAPGVRAFTSRFAEELFWRAKTLESLAERHRASTGRG